MLESICVISVSKHSSESREQWHLEVLGLLVGPDASSMMFGGRLVQLPDRKAYRGPGRKVAPVQCTIFSHNPLVNDTSTERSNDSKQLRPVDPFLPASSQHDIRRSRQLRLVKGKLLGSYITFALCQPTSQGNREAMLTFFFRSLFE